MSGTDRGRIDTGQPVFLPFRMSCFVISNLVVTAGMLTPNMKVRVLATYPLLFLSSVTY